MRKFILLVGALVVSSTGFADITSTGLSKNSSTLKSLGSAFQSTQTAHIAPNQKNITIVYGGEDVARNAIINPATVA